jgi:hypothetical protein
VREFPVPAANAALRALCLGEEQVLISRRYNFIFVHIHKNAGTSISKALTPFAVSRVQYEVVRTLKTLRIPLPRHWDPAPFDTHITASALAARLGRDVFQSFFSFAIVRNPWDWNVSLYAYILKNNAHPQYGFVKSLGSFNRFIQWRCEDVTFQQKDFVCSENGGQLVDFVGRYENLQHDFDHICSRIGVSARLPTLNASERKHYREYYDDVTAELVQKTFQPDISHFGYDFDSGHIHAPAPDAVHI